MERPQNLVENIVRQARRRTASDVDILHAEAILRDRFTHGDKIAKKNLREPPEHFLSRQHKGGKGAI